ncbi:MAG: phage tail protein [Gammaproteobacteria bacterium]|nr:phage tail protein [Gammaproteobacteria bacterium]
MIEVNPNQWLLLTGEQDFPETSRYHWNSECHAYMFKTEHKLNWPTKKTAGLSQLSLADNSPMIMDSFSQVGRLSDDKSHIEYNAGKGFFTLQDSELNPVGSPSKHYHSLDIGGQTLISAAYTENDTDYGITLFHLSQRWQTDLKLSEKILASTIDHENNLWLVNENQLTLCQGEPLHIPFQKPEEDIVHFKPQHKNPNQLRKIWSQTLPADWQISAIRHDKYFLYLLGNGKETNSEEQQIIFKRERTLKQNSDFTGYLFDETLPFATDLHINDNGHFLLQSLIDSSETEFKQYIDSPNIKLKDPEQKGQMGSTQIIHTSYPMLSPQSPRLIHCSSDKVYYQSSQGIRELSARIQARYPTHGRVTIRKELDSGSNNTIWHRIYLDAKIPVGAQIIIYAGTYNTHKNTIHYYRQTDLIWNPIESELPYTKNPAGHEKDRAGLFELLLQSSKGNIRQLQGRHLALRIVMTCDGKQSPLIYNLRAYYPRFCYQQAYLPAHFQQQEELDNSQLLANGADVRERMLASFEGMLTPIEAKIANADILFDTQSTDADFLPELSNLLGKSLPVHWPEARQRRYIESLGKLQRWNGTLRGLQLILDIISDGAVARGEIIIVENFRLRRTLSTLLGVDFSNEIENHPLTLGTGQSGNSIVGSNLILSNENAREFLALLAPQLANESDEVALELFFEHYSHQTSIILHGKSKKQEHLVIDILNEYMPAHLQWNIYQSDHPFILGLSPLLEINTFIETQPEPRQVQLDDTYLGYEGLLINPAALSPDDVNRLSE